MNRDQKIAKAFHTCKDKAIDTIITCMYPSCAEKAINSHILQKNGILSSIAEDNHLMEMHINKFKDEEHFFKRIGINKAFSFNCFCPKHDTELFKSIETEEIDFSLNKNLLLFTLRTIYNEKYRKLVNIGMYECLLANHSDLLDRNFSEQLLSQQKLGLEDISKTEAVIWNDLNNGIESFVFKVKEISRKEICLSAFYDFETTKELQDYLLKYGKQKEGLIEIFVSLFPYKAKSIFMMGYKKIHKPVVESYVENFFADNEKRLERKITNLMMFRCETWVISQQFYSKYIKSSEDAFNFAVAFSEQNMNERIIYDLNIFQGNFPNKFEIFKKNAHAYLQMNRN